MSDPVLSTIPGDEPGAWGNSEPRIPHTAEIAVVIKRRGYRTVWIMQPLDLGYIEDDRAWTDRVKELAQRAWDKQTAEGQRDGDGCGEH